MEEKTLVKVTFEYEDGSKTWVEGKDAGEWNEQVNSALLIAQVHGCSVKIGDLAWKNSPPVV